MFYINIKKMLHIISIMIRELCLFIKIGIKKWVLLTQFNRLKEI